MKKIITAVVLVLMILTVLALGLKENPEATADGTITINLVNENTDLVETKEIEFFIGDNLFDLVKENFEVTFLVSWQHGRGGGPRGSGTLPSLRFPDSCTTLVQGVHLGECSLVN